MWILVSNKMEQSGNSNGESSDFGKYGDIGLSGESGDLGELGDSGDHGITLKLISLSLRLEVQFHPCTSSPKIIKTSIQ